MTTETTTAIELQQVSLPYGLQPVDCRLPKNRLIGILGGNGAGKSTLLKAIAGIITPTSGCIRLNGQDLSNLDYRARSKLLAYLAQDTPVRWALTVADVIALGMDESLAADREYQRVYTAADYFALLPMLNKPVHQLSGGERARVHLARCLVKNTPILLADEPIAALDPYYQIDIMEHFKSLSQTMTCVVVLHQLSLAYRYCDTVLLLKEGQIIAAGETKNVLIAENLATAFKISATIDASNQTIYNIRKR